MAAFHDLPTWWFGPACRTLPYEDVIADSLVLPARVVGDLQVSTCARGSWVMASSQIDDVALRGRTTPLMATWSTSDLVTRTQGVAGRWH